MWRYTDDLNPHKFDNTGPHLSVQNSFWSNQSLHHGWKTRGKKILLVYARHLWLAKGCFWGKERWGVCLYLRYFWCIRAHAHTHCIWCAQVWAKGSRQDTFRARRIQVGKISACVHPRSCITCTCTYIVCWAEEWNLDQPLFFSQRIFSSEKEKQKTWTQYRRDLDSDWIWAHRPSAKDTRLFSEVIKAIIIMPVTAHTSSATEGYYWFQTIPKSRAILVSKFECGS